MNGFRVIALLILAIGLAYNYKQDSGMHQKAKVYQAICLGVIGFAYSGTFGYIAWLVSHLAEAQQKFGVAVGYIPGPLHWLFYLLHLGLSLLALLTAYRMINRTEAARKRLLVLLPFLAFAETFNFYRSWLSGGAEVPLMHALGALLGLFINAGLATALLFIYRSKFMKAFFGSSLVSAPASGELAVETTRS